MEPRNEGPTTALASAISTLIALQIVTLVAVVGGSWYVHNELKQQLSLVASAGGPPNPPQSVENWEEFVRPYNAAVGPTNATVVVVEFSDFQCPYCKRFAEGTRQVIASEYGDNVRMVFKHYPLEQIHPHAMTAAIAAQCARREGKFWVVHERFFSQPDVLDVESVISIGRSVGLSDGYVRCIMREETRPEVEQDIQDALDVGVPATLTFMVNGKFLVGSQSEAAFASVFREAGLDID